MQESLIWDLSSQKKMEFLDVRIAQGSALEMNDANYGIACDFYFIPDDEE